MMFAEHSLPGKGASFLGCISLS